jgi:RNA polymerase sigma-B factor
MTVSQILRAPTVAELAARLDVDEEVVLDALTAEDHLIPDLVECPVDCDTLRSLLTRVSPWESQLLQLRFFDGLTRAEIGERVGISQPQVCRLINRTLRNLGLLVLAE